MSYSSVDTDSDKKRKGFWSTEIENRNRYEPRTHCRYVKTVLAIVYGYVLLNTIMWVFLARFATSPDLRVSVICFSTQVGPEWMGWYQPMVQWCCGIGSILLFLLTLAFIRKRASESSLNTGRDSVQMKRQKKITLSIGKWRTLTVVCMQSL